MPQEVTELLERIEAGQSHASEELLPLVYEELRRLARSRMAREKGTQTLQPTALVHEAYLRLVGDAGPEWDHRGHFFAAAAEAMRRIMVERARRKNRLKHGAEFEKTSLDPAEIQGEEGDSRLLVVNELLDQLTESHSQKAEVVKLKYFVGFTNAEAAQALGVSEKTVNRDWRFARAWILSKMGVDC